MQAFIALPTQLATVSMAVSLLVLSACTNQELKSEMPDVQRKALQASIQEEGIAIVADGCVRAEGFYGFIGSERPVAKQESIALAATVALRFNLGLVEHGYKLKSIAFPFICARGICMQKFGKPWMVSVVEKTGDPILDEQELPLVLPNTGKATYQAYIDFFSVLKPVIGAVGAYPPAKLKENIKITKNQKLFIPRILSSVQAIINTRYVLVCAAQSSTRTPATNAAAVVITILTLGQGAAVLNQPPGQEKFKDLHLLLIDLKENKLIWGDAYYEEANEKMTTELGVWSLLTPLH